MSLDEVLRQRQPYQPRALPSLAPLAAATERVLARWPDAVKEPPETDRERIVAEMKRRLETGDWRGLRTTFVTMAAVAVFDPARRTRDDLAALRQFYYDEIRVNESAAFLSGMVGVYLGSYQPGAPHTVELGRRLGKVAGRLGGRWAGLLQAVPRLLDGMSAHQQVAQLMLSMPTPFDNLKTIGLRKPHDAGLMSAAHLAFVKAMAPALRSPPAIDKMIAWLRPDGVQQPKSEGAAEAVAALLAPWTHDPPEEIGADLTRRLTGLYGDPRTRGGEAPWNTVPEELVERIVRWLTGENIRFFMDIVSDVEASHMWEPRRRFWLQIHEERRIDSAWVALSEEGARLARKRANGRPGLAFGRQTAGGRWSKTNLLVLKIEGKIVVEGSHDYLVHLFREGAPGAPRLYQARYDGEAIRLIPGADARKHTGNWQGWVRERI